MRVNVVALPRDDAVGNEHLFPGVDHSRNTSACGRDYTPGNSKQQVLQGFDGDLLRIVSPCHAQDLMRGSYGRRVTFVSLFDVSCHYLSEILFLTISDNF